MASELRLRGLFVVNRDSKPRSQRNGRNRFTNYTPAERMGTNSICVGAFDMKTISTVFCGALALLGLAALAQPALAGGYHYDHGCNCMRPDYQYNTRHVVREAPEVRTHRRYVDHMNVVRHTRLVQENRQFVHIRPIINREVVVHRQNTLVRNVTLHRLNVSHALQFENHYEQANVYAPGWTHVVNESHNVHGCGCGHVRGLFHGHAGYEGGPISSLD